MKIIDNPREEAWPALATRPAANNPDLQDAVRKILDRVRSSGDNALYQLTELYDRVIISSLRVADDEIRAAERKVPHDLRLAIETAARNIERFHEAQRLNEPDLETMPGVRCWRKAMPIEKVGLYVPGGSAPLLSTVLMLAIPARIAGCKSICMCSPPGEDGHIAPSVLHAAAYAGVTRVFSVGGAQAIAAMAYGTESIPRCDKIFGPGNSYVTTAKQIVSSDGAAIDMPAGPTEVLIIADETANPAFVAADLLAQAEHGPDSQVVLVATDSQLVSAVVDELNRQTETLPRRNIAEGALRNSMAITFPDINKAIAFSNTYAPEHLLLQTKDASDLVPAIRHAGSVFIGSFSPEAAGDYASGTNHTLPTNGFARSYGGVSLDSFQKYITFQQLSEQGLQKLASAVIALAEAEQLEGHKRSVTIRLESTDKP